MIKLIQFFPKDHLINTMEKNHLFYSFELSIRIISNLQDH